MRPVNGPEIVLDVVIRHFLDELLNLFLAQRFCEWRWQNPRERNVGTVRRGRVTGRPLDEDTQYGIRQFSARGSNQKHQS